MKNLHKLVVTATLVFSVNKVWAAASDVYLLTQPLNISTSEDLKQSSHYGVSGQPTLLKKISVKNGIAKVKMVQVNGVVSEQVGYVAAKWFTQGTRIKAIDPFQIDPNKIIKQVVVKSPVNCPPDASKPVVDENGAVVTPPVVVPPPVVVVNPYVADACYILKGERNTFTSRQKEDFHLACLDNIKRKLSITNRDTAYQAISKLYSLPKEQQVFMAQLMTMYGEASGAVPPAEQMAAVLQIIDNRTRVAKQRYRGANQLDVVLQNAQFSMYNPNDFNWKRALFASKSELRTAVHVLANRSQYPITAAGKNTVRSIYHYMASELCGGENHPAWAVECKDSTVLTVNRKKLEAANGHVFFPNVSWSFNPTNRYKTYARSHGGVI